MGWGEPRPAPDQTHQVLQDLVVAGESMVYEQGWGSEGGGVEGATVVEVRFAEQLARARRCIDATP